MIRINRKALLQSGMLVLCAAAMLAVISVGFRVYVSRYLNIQDVYVASRDIPPRTKIEEDDLMVLHIPQAYVLEHTYTRKEDILGKYTEIQGMIPAGSAFYLGMLYEEKDLPDYPSSQLKQGQAAYTAEIDYAKLGGPIIAGQRVDIYVSVEKRDELPVTDCLFEGVRVLSVKDFKGLEINDPNSSGTPYFVILAINKEDVNTLSVAEKVGDIRMIASSNTYNTEEEAVLCADSPIIRYLTEQENEDLL